MAEPGKQADNAQEARREADDYQRQGPEHVETHDLPRENSGASLNQDIRERTMRPHKGDVGRAETNEEIFQGSKMRELP